MQDTVIGILRSEDCIPIEIATILSTLLAAAALNSTSNLSAFEYLFNPEDLPVEAIQQFPALPALKPEVKAFVERMAKAL